MKWVYLSPSNIYLNGTELRKSKKSRVTFSQNSFLGNEVHGDADNRKRGCRRKYKLKVKLVGVLWEGSEKMVSSTLNGGASSEDFQYVIM